MARSIMQEDKQCYICEQLNNLERHHIFGAFNRNNSEKYGLTVWLCHDCHNEPPLGVHHNAKVRHWLQDKAQREFEKQYPNLDFVSIFGRNYKE